MRTLARAFFLFGSVSLLSACITEEDSLGTKRDNQNGNQSCSGIDPSTLGCGDGSSCPSGYVCDPNACHPSSCGCDGDTGSWVCTADCGFGTCVPQGQNPVCEGPNPADGCDKGCPSGYVCDPNACRSSSCGCDAATGDWICTADCGEGGACVPENQAGTCQGPNPADGCGAGCPAGTVCDPNACKPSACGCDPATDSWMCTTDCGEGGACVPENQSSCPGPNPADGCDQGCPSGTVCDPKACRPSICQCDSQLGSWLCTSDCGSGGTCVPS